MQHLYELFIFVGSLRKMIKKMSESKTEDEKTKNFEPLQEIITNVQFASDEGDFGESAGTVQ